MLIACATLVITELAWAQGVERSPGSSARTVDVFRADRTVVTGPSQRAGRPRRGGTRRVASGGEPVGFDARPDSNTADSAAAARSRADSVASARTRTAADRDRRLRIVISLADRRLWALIGVDTLLDGPVAVSSDASLDYGGKTWRFETPRGVRTVRAKRDNPVWVPPDWHYAEVAREHALGIKAMKARKTVLSDGRWLEVRDSVVGIVDTASGEFDPLRTDEEIVFDDTLFIPPVGTLNRRIEGELGEFALDTGNGILLHGTPHKETIGSAATHGCIRLRDDDIRWLHEMIPIGARVYIY